MSLIESKSVIIKSPGCNDNYSFSGIDICDNRDDDYDEDGEIDRYRSAAKPAAD